jgi:hypothetical protein
MASMRIWTRTAKLFLLVLAGCPLPCPKGTRTTGGDQCLPVERPLASLPMAAPATIVNWTNADVDIEIEVSKRASPCAEIGTEDEPWAAMNALPRSIDAFSVPDRYRLATARAKLPNGGALEIPVSVNACAAVRVWAGKGDFRRELMAASGERFELHGSDDAGLSLVGPRGVVPSAKDLPSCATKPPMFDVGLGSDSTFTVREIVPVTMDQQPCERVVVASTGQIRALTLCQPGRAWPFAVGAPLALEGAAGGLLVYRVDARAERVRSYRGETRGLQTETKALVGFQPSEKVCRLGAIGVVRRGHVLFDGKPMLPGESVISGTRRVYIHDAYRVFGGNPPFAGDHIEALITDRAEQ